jgi:hypothetical protein
MRGWSLRAWCAACVCLCAGGLVACSSGSSSSSSDGPGPTVRHSTTTTTIDVAKVPATITVAYAQAVMDALDRALGDGLRVFARTKAPSPEFDAYLKAIYDGPAYEKAVAEFGRTAAQSPDNVRPDPGDPETTVSRVLGASHDCVYAAVNRSFAKFLVTTIPSTLEGYVELMIKNPQRDPVGLNPTVWAMVADDLVSNGAFPPNPCR